MNHIAERYNKILVKGSKNLDPIYDLSYDKGEANVKNKTAIQLADKWSHHGEYSLIRVDRLGITFIKSYPGGFFII